MYSSNFNNLILNSDSYKTSHWLQYPPDSQYMSSYVEARKGDHDVVFFGLQAFIKEYLQAPITTADIDEAEMVITAHGLPFNRSGWERLVEKHDGRLPIRIQAVPEGSIVPVSNVVCQIVNTDPEFSLSARLLIPTLSFIGCPVTSKLLSCVLFGILLPSQACLIFAKT